MERRLTGFAAGVALALAASAAASQGASSEWAPRAEDETARPRAAPEPIRDDDGVRRFAAHALALRAEVVEGGGAAVLARIPGVPAQAPPGLWPPVFENAMVAFGRLRSPAPVALYYNPLLDVAVSTAWERRDGGWRVAAARLLPGERLGGGRGLASPLPSWLSVDDAPVEALAAAASARIEAFRRAHPPEAGEAARNAVAFAAAAADARAAWPRLLWNARQRVRWTSDGEAWLRPALAEISGALAAGDAGAVTAAAPATDPETAEAVAGLPRALAARLVLDMVLSAGADGRLLIGSLPDDGEMYFLVLCRLEGAACALRRIVMVSVLDGGGRTKG